MTRWTRTSCLTGILVLALVLGFGSAAGAENGRTQQLAQRLTALLDRQSLDSIAARDPDQQDVFVAALYFPNMQLLVVSAQYAAPVLLNEKILRGDYRDVYIDLNAASIPETKVLVEDLRANGISPDRKPDEPFDSYTEGTGPRVNFDGEWRAQKLSEAEYVRLFQRAEERYARMLQTLLRQLEPPGPDVP